MKNSFHKGGRGRTIIAFCPEDDWEHSLYSQFSAARQYYFNTSTTLTNVPMRPTSHFLSARPYRLSGARHSG
ncbi:hypothetical protein D3C80_634900 [compost metagenome]